MTEQRPPIALRIQAGVDKAIADGLQPKSIYLTPDDCEQLLAGRKRAGVWWEGEPEPTELSGLQLRRVSGRGASKIYCRHGIARAIPSRPP